MNIYSPRGSKVQGIFVNGELQNGYNAQKVHAEKYIKEGITYTVHHTNVDRWHTDVYLEEFPDTYFNSMHFKNIN